MKEYDCAPGNYCPPRAVCENPCTSYHQCSITQKCSTTQNERNETVPICLGPCDYVRCPGSCVEKLRSDGSAYAECVTPEPSPPNPCKGYNCPRDQTCVLMFGHSKPQCMINPCRNTTVCPKGEYCYPNQVQCIRAPCPPIGECENPCDRLDCKNGTSCVIKPYNCDPGYCPPRAVCQDLCAEHTCPPTQKCTTTPDENNQQVAICEGPCATVRCAGLCVEKLGPDGPFAQCYPREPTYPPPNPCSGCNCSGNKTCVLTSESCAKFPCKTFAACSVNPCEGYRCPKGQSCYPTRVTCIRSPCNPVPRCHRPCEYVQCKPGYGCVVEESNCPVVSYCPPQGVCKIQ